MNATQPRMLPERLAVTFTLAHLLQKLDASQAPVAPDQYRSVVSRLSDELARVAMDDDLQAVLNTFPAAAELYKHRVATMGYDRPMTRCMPHGVPDAMTVAGLPFKILQVPGVTLVLFEEFHVYRQLFTDGRKLPVDPDPAWYGYSVGRWEGDTFVVETAGFKEGSWLDNSGHPHSDALKLTERFRRLNFGRMELVVTVDDPKVYTKTWTSDTLRFNLQPDTELLEHLCENNRDLDHLQEIWEKPDNKP